MSSAAFNIGVKTMKRSFSTVNIKQGFFLLQVLGKTCIFMCLFVPNLTCIFCYDLIKKQSFNRFCMTKVYTGLFTKGVCNVKSNYVYSCVAVKD